MEENLMGMDSLVDPYVIRVVICDEISKVMDSSFTYEKIKEYVENVKVNLSKGDISKFLDEEFDREYPELRRRVKKNNYSDYGEKLSDRLKAMKYQPNDTLEYFTTYIDILREKSLKLLNVLDLLISLKNKSVDNSDINILTDLDIEVKNGNILYKDMIRLVNPIVENITDLKKYVDLANNPYSYLQININKDLIYFGGGNFNELFPTRDLQVKSLEYDGSLRGLIPLTDKQKYDINKRDKKNYSYVLSLLDDLK